MIAVAERSLPALVSTRKPFAIFSLPCPVVKGSDKVALVGTWHPARVKPPQNLIIHKAYLCIVFIYSE